MNEKEIEAVEKMIKVYYEKYNRRFYYLSLFLIAALMAANITFSIVISNMNKRMADIASDMSEMSVKQWELYMTTDYGYPDMTNQVEVNNR